jgi:hypothetical protein
MMVCNKQLIGNKMRGDYNTLSLSQQLKHNRAVGQLEKLTINYFNKLNDEQLKSLMLKLLNAEIMSLRITRKLFVEKIIILNQYLKENRNIDLHN